MESILKLSVGGLPPLSARGCTQTLTPLPLGHQKRTINGELVHWGDQGVKYKSHIQCQDQTVLATDGLYPGVDVMVECIQPLWQRVDSFDEDEISQSIRLDRTPVKGSVIAMTSEREYLDVSCDEDFVRFPKMAESIFVCYRPQLRMQIRHYELFTNEWGLNSGWKLDLEEV